MTPVGKIDTHHKALTINLDLTNIGSFAEIGAGQEVSRWFLVVGGASGTVAKTISAYDKEVSDDLYGPASRYVSMQRLEAMLDREWVQLRGQLETHRGSQTRFFAFVDTLSALNFKGTNEGHGWIGIRFQREAGGLPSDLLLHINLRDATSVLQQDAVGILGVNLIYAAFYQLSTKESFFAGLGEDVVPSRIEIDFVEFRGPAFANWDRAEALAHLVYAGFAEAVLFPSDEVACPPAEILHKRSVLLAPGNFDHVDPVHGLIHERLLEAGIRELHREATDATGVTPSGASSVGIFCVSAAPLTPQGQRPEISNLLRRIDALVSRGGNVLLFQRRELYAMTDFVNRHTNAPLRFVVGLSLLLRTLNDQYFNLEGKRLEALARLFAQDVRIYVYPMRAPDLEEAVKDFPHTGLEWDETNEWVSANQLRIVSPIGHLYNYLISSNFLSPISVPS